MRGRASLKGYKLSNQVSAEKNDKVFDNTLSDAKGVVDRISALHYEFCMAHARTDNGHHPSQSHTAVIFDNSYFKNLVGNKGLLHSDQQLFNGGSTDSQVTTYSDNPFTFKADFADAMVKMGNMSLLTGTAGQIRTNCRKVN
ncbi:hypothetical protein V6N13_019901 [Hibiscus sabdariffa]